MRRFLLLTGCYLFFASANSQTFTSNKKDTFDSINIVNNNYFKTHFLWFTGNWNDRKNIFSTTAFVDTLSDDGLFVGGGIKLTVSPQGTVAIQSHKLDEWNKKIEEGLTILQKAEDSLKMPSGDAKEWAHHFNGVLLPELDAIKKEWKSYKVPSKELMNVKAGAKQSPNTQSYRETLFSACERLGPDYEKVMAFYNAHKKDKQKDITYVPPPAYSNTCLSCDTSLARLYDIQDSMYAENFFEPESDLTKTALEILKQMSLLGIDKAIIINPNDETGAALLDAFKSSKDPSQAGPCNYFHYDELMEAAQFLVRRNYDKAAKMFIDYRKNVETARPAIYTFLHATRNTMLYGVMSNDDANLAEVAGLLAKEVDYFLNQKLLQEHDWSQLANIPFIYGLERQKELAGGQESEVYQQIGELLNSFHLHIEMDIKVGKENKAYQLTHLKGETKITPEFNYDKDSCYRWIAIEDQPDMYYGFPRPAKKTSQKIECDLITNEMVGPGPHPVYIGTKKYYVLLNGLKMDYCHPGKDTILLSSFIAEPNPNAGTWQFPMMSPQPMGTFQIEHMFQSVSTMKQLAASGKATQQADIMKQQGMQIAAQMKSVQAQMAGKKGTASLEDLHKIQDLATKAMNLKNNENAAPVLSIDFPLQTQNNTATLHDKRYDAKEINPEIPAIIYGYYTIKVVYEKQKKN